MNNSPYLDRPLLPLAVALPRMLQEIEAAFATVRPRSGVSAGGVDPRVARTQRITSFPRRDLNGAIRLGSRSSGVGGLTGGRGPDATGAFSSQPLRVADGELPERSNGAVSKCA